MNARGELERIIRRQRVIGAAILGDPAWEILLDLADAGPLKTSAVGASTRIPATTALRYIRMLEKQGLIERDSLPGDSRLTIVTLSEAGREAVERCLA